MNPHAAAVRSFSRPGKSFLALRCLIILVLTAVVGRAATWIWDMSGIGGGGFGLNIVADPFNANYATIGGDSWGVYNTTNKGNKWFAATKGLGVQGAEGPLAGYFNFCGLGYSIKHPGRVWCLTGKLENANSGNFGYVVGNAYTVVNTTIRGGESTASGGSEGDHPRPSGNRVVVDYNTSTGVEIVYVGTGTGGGVWRAKDDGVIPLNNTWTLLGLSGLSTAITSMVQDPNDFTKLYVGTKGDKAYLITGVRGSTQTTTHLNNAPTLVQKVVAVGGNVYAACGTAGIKRVENDGATWTNLGGTTFTSTGSIWSAIGGNVGTGGNIVLYAGCTNPNGAKSIAKSTDGGNTWSWITPPSAISLQVWGQSYNWWLGLAEPRVLPGNGQTYESTTLEVDKFNPSIVYSAGRSGCWKSEDAGATWRPAMNGLGGTMHWYVKAATSGAGAWCHDVDWTGQSTSNHFWTATQDLNPPAFNGQQLSITKGGHTYQLVLNVVRDFKVDNVSIADEFFRATCVRALDIDVSADGNYIYVAQRGGGILVAHKSTAPWP